MNLLLSIALLVDAARAAPAYEDQVVRLSITWQAWETAQPWAKTNPQVRTAQATVVPGGPRGGGYLLATAQIVENATLVRARKHGEPDEFVARVVLVDREANLALLSVDEPGFFDDLSPVKLAKAPIAEGDVTIVRWRENQLEAVDGKVARAVTFDSATGVLGYAGLRITSDLSGGGWAEPVFAGGRLVGLVTSMSGSEAGVMPIDFVASWLADAESDGAVRPWVGDLGISVESVRSPALAAWLGLPEPRGILVLAVAQGGSACGTLRRGDVLWSIAGQALDGSGSVKHPLYGLISYEAVLTAFHPGDRLPVEVMREGKLLPLELELRSYTGENWLVPANRITPPPYLMAGGLVFREYDESYAARATELRIVTEVERHGQSADRQRIVVMSTVLPDPYNLGYHGFGDLRVAAVNGVPVDRISDVAAALKAPQGGYHVVTLHPNYRIAEIVLDAATFDEATARIAAAYGVDPTWRAEAIPPDGLKACE